MNQLPADVHSFYKPEFSEFYQVNYPDRVTRFYNGLPDFDCPYTVAIFRITRRHS
jgi:hypothetical protein